jgi:signal peptidase I
MRRPRFLDPDAPYDADPDGIDADGLTREQRTANRLAWSLLLPLTVILVALVLVFFVLFDHVVVSGPSMIPTLLDGDYILTTKTDANVKRGDVVVLNVVEQGKATEWVKRVVGLAGDRVHIEGDFALVNGVAETFPHRIIALSRTRPTEDVTVPAGMVFVMGDNRPVSLDSRYVGTLPVSAIAGKAVFTYAPIDRIGTIPGP